MQRATACMKPATGFFLCFNPRPRAEGDKSTIRRGNRLLGFNPRPRAEGDTIIYPTFIVFCVSIHALVQRATIYVDYGVWVVWRFNPRPRAEGDTTSKRNSLKRIMFQSTPSCRGRHDYAHKAVDHSKVSIHALVQRATARLS